MMNYRVLTRKITFNVINVILEHWIPQPKGFFAIFLIYSFTVVVFLLQYSGSYYKTLIIRS